MRRIILSFACLAVLAGCAGDPQRVVDQNRRYDLTSALQPRPLAACVMHNARAFAGDYTADITELVRPENFQTVVMRTSIGPVTYEPILVARTWPTVNGSQMAIYADAGLGAAAEADWIARLRRGCEVAVRSTSLVPVVPVVVPGDAAPAVTPPPPASPPPAGRQPRG